MQSKLWNAFATISILFLVHVGDSACFTKQWGCRLFLLPFILSTFRTKWGIIKLYSCLLSTCRCNCSFICLLWPRNWFYHSG